MGFSCMGNGERWFNSVLQGIETGFDVEVRTQGGQLKVRGITIVDRPTTGLLDEMDRTLRV